MNSRWRLLAASVLLTAAVLTLVHWHQNRDDQRCELCRVQQLPSLFTPPVDTVARLAVQGWHVSVAEIVSQTESFVPTTFGRAPPAILFS